MQLNQTFFKLKLLREILRESSKAKELLLDECINMGGTDPVILMRRFRMLSQLSQWESDIINKIYNFEITTLDEFKDNQMAIKHEIFSVINRSA